MYNNLLDLLKKPALWQRSSEPFWDDEHISKGMLEAHLNPEWDAASRKHSYIDRSAQWLSTVIPAQAKNLDLGCGPGLYTKRLSDRGYDVIGMDYSKRSIAYAKSQDAKTEYIYKSYLELDYADMFDAVTLIYCDYAALTPDERRTLIAKVYQALKAGGLFIMDVFSENKFINKNDKTSWTLCKKTAVFGAPNRISALKRLISMKTIRLRSNNVLWVKNDEMKEYLIWDTALHRTKADRRGITVWI
jgi:SAM-dependent methyltransferase